MTLTMTAVPLPLRTDNSGTVRVGNTRMSLDIVIDTFKQGADPEEIVRQYPTLELKDVYAAVTYYLYNQAEVEAYRAEQARETAEIERTSRAQWEASDFYKRAIAIKAQRES